MIIHFEKAIQINSKDDINHLGKILGDNNMSSKKVNVSEIAREAGVSWDTANRRLNNLNKGYNKLRPSKVDKVRDIIIDIFDDNNVEVSSIEGFYGYICREYTDLVDFKVGAFKSYIKTRFNDEYKKKKSSLYSTRFETPPGLQVQFDFKESYKIVLRTGEIKKLDVAVLQLGYSRMVYRSIIPNKKTETVLNFLACAFEHWGVVPHEIVFDNAKCLVDTPATNTTEAILNSKFEAFCDDYNIDTYACRAYRPQTKGKVESTMRKLNDLSFYNGKLDSVYHYHEKVEALTDESNRKIHSTTKIAPVLAFEIEKKHMQPLPKESIRSFYKMSSKTIKTVANTGTIQFGNSAYSVTYKLIGKQVEVIQSIDDLLLIYYNNKFVTMHEKVENSLSINPEDVLPSLKNGEYGKTSRRKKLAQIIPIEDKNIVDASDEVSSQASHNLESLEGAY